MAVDRTMAAAAAGGAPLAFLQALEVEAVEPRQRRRPCWSRSARRAAAAAVGLLCAVALAVDFFVGGETPSAPAGPCHVARRLNLLDRLPRLRRRPASPHDYPELFMSRCPPCDHDLFASGWRALERRCTLKETRYALTEIDMEWLINMQQGMGMALDAYRCEDAVFLLDAYSKQSLTKCVSIVPVLEAEEDEVGSYFDDIAAEQRDDVNVGRLKQLSDMASNSSDGRLKEVDGKVAAEASQGATKSSGGPPGGGRLKTLLDKVVAKKAPAGAPTPSKELLNATEASGGGPGEGHVEKLDEEVSKRPPVNASMPSPFFFSSHGISGSFVVR